MFCVAAESEQRVNPVSQAAPRRLPRREGSRSRRKKPPLSQSRPPTGARNSEVPQEHEVELVAAFHDPQKMQLERRPVEIAHRMPMPVRIAPALLRGLPVLADPVGSIGRVEFLFAERPLVSASVPWVDEEVADRQ